MNREGTRNQTEKEIPKRSGPKGASPSGKLNGPVCCRHKRERCQKKSACDYCHSPECPHCKSKSGCKCWCVFLHSGKGGDDKHQLSGNVTTAIQLEDAPELNCVLKDGQLSTFTVRSVLQKTSLGHQERHNSDCVSVETRRATARDYSAGSINDRNPIALGCEDLHQHWIQH